MFIFLFFALLFLFYYLLYIHPIGHFQVAFCLCVKTSLNAKPFIWLPPTGSFFMPIKLRFRTIEDSLWNKSTRKHSSMSCLTGAFDSFTFLVLSNDASFLGLFPSGWSVIWDHPDHGASKEPVTPLLMHYDPSQWSWITNPYTDHSKGIQP